MRFLNAVLCMLLVVGLIFSLAGCFSGGKINIDKDGDIKIKGEDGELEIGKAKWDGSKMHGIDAPKAKLESYVSSDGSTVYVFSEMKEEDAEAYVEKLKEAGFTYNTFVMDDYSFTGTNKDGKTVSFTYDKDSGEGMISAGEGTKPEEEDDGEEAVIGGSNKKWSSEKMGGLPDPGATIVTYWSADGDTSYSFEKIENHLEYIEEIKACGFTVDPSVVEVDSTYIYSASNSNGDTISFSASSDAATITFTKNKTE